MKYLHTSRLQDLVGAVNVVGGNIDHPDILAEFHPVKLDFDTQVDQELSPFSDEYLQQQISLYNEIAGRDLNQADGELHHIDISNNINAPNPLNIRNVAHVAEHVRAVSSMLALASLNGEAKVLDMGAGHGLSSEVYAFSGCHVTAVDIDPLLSELAQHRSNARHLPIIRINASFDDLSIIEDGRYEAAFFFQSLHHCIRPWDLISQLKHKLTPNGIIAFTGEPIQTNWWRHWGLRLDLESLFVARSYGWFESGWSRSFISECFARSGMDLLFFDGGHGGGEIGIATLSDARADVINATARQLGFAPPAEVRQIPDHAFATISGARSVLANKPAYRGAEAGVLLYGPYISLSPGEYEITMFLHSYELNGGNIIIDVVSGYGDNIHFKETVSYYDRNWTKIMNRRFSISERVVGLEIRAIILSGDWEISIPTIRAL